MEAVKTENLQNQICIYKIICFTLGYCFLPINIFYFYKTVTVPMQDFKISFL